MMKKRLILLIILIQFVYSGWSEPVFISKEATQYILQESSMLTLFTPEEETVDDITDQQADMIPYPRQYHGISRQPLWTWLEFSFEQEGSYILSLNNHKIEKYDVYVYSKEGVFLLHKHFDKSIPFFEREIPGLVPSVTLDIEEDILEVDCYIRCETQSSMKINMTLYTLSGYLSRLVQTEWLYLFIAGALLFLFFYNLIVFLSSGDWNYFYYSLYVFFSLFYMLSIEGYGDALFWPGVEWMYPRSYNLAITFNFISGLLFAASYLKTKKHLPRIHVFLRSMTAITLMLGAGFFFTVENWLVNLGTLAILINLGLFLLAGILSMRLKQEAAGFFTLAWSFMLVGTVITTFKRLGFLPYNYFTENALYFGQLIEVVLLARALGSKIAFYQRKAVATEKALTRAQYNILQNRMSPHFLFNTLTLIFSELEQNVAAAQRSLIRLADNYRYLTDMNGKKLVMAGDERKFIENYLMLMKARFGDDFKFKIIWDNALNTLPIPPLCIQPLIENSFKHGLWSTKNKRIRVEGLFEGNQVRFLVFNNGVKPPKKVTESRTYNNIRARLSLYYPHVELFLQPDSEGSMAVLIFQMD